MVRDCDHGNVESPENTRLAHENLEILYVWVWVVTNYFI
jgi:hypothetical protein